MRPIATRPCPTSQDCEGRADVSKVIVKGLQYSPLGFKCGFVLALLMLFFQFQRSEPLLKIGYATPPGGTFKALKPVIIIKDQLACPPLHTQCHTHLSSPSSPNLILTTSTIAAMMMISLAVENRPSPTDRRELTDACDILYRSSSSVSCQ
jgi:hypothetical protein